MLVILFRLVAHGLMVAHSWCVLPVTRSLGLVIDPLIFESFPARLESSHSDSSCEVKLLSPQWTLSLSVEVVIESEETLLSVTRLEELTSILRIILLVFCTRSCVKKPCWFPWHFFHVQGDGSFLERWSVRISLIFGSGLDDLQVCLFQCFPFPSTAFKREDEVSTRNWVLPSDWTVCACIWRSSFAVMRKATVFLCISRFSCAFIRTLVSELASCWALELCTFGNMPIIIWNSLLTISSWGLYKVVCSLHFPWRTFTSKCWCAFCASVITILSITFRISVR